MLTSCGLLWPHLDVSADLFSGMLCLKHIWGWDLAFSISTVRVIPFPSILYLVRGTAGD